ncbi:MAG: fibronectin/fibrinogen-binding protein [Ruminococcaceae bacterium]|nr:fibronectin/fibrinogen-binding protein [Oscillospiraceae bacterium]
MALDGIFLTKIKNELNDKAVGLRVDKVNQPTNDEVVLNLRGRNGNYRLLFCVRADSPRLHFTSHPIDNPPVPPMFCMLLRKYLTGAAVKGFRQQECDRILFVDFDATNEIGDRIEVSLCIEIMGKYSNLILIRDGKIIDALKRVDFTTSSVRQILPGLDYRLPPKQDKLCISDCSIDEIMSRILSYKDKSLSSAIMSTLQGVSPVVARELSHRAAFEDISVSQLRQENISILNDAIGSIRENLSSYDEVYMLTEEKNKPKDMSHIEVRQYGDALNCKKYESPSELLDDFYFERDRINRINHRGRELIRLLNNLIERTARKINLRQQELKRCEDKDTLKLYGELIVANLYRLTKGSSFYEVENYYDDCKLIRIPCNPALSPQENQKKYYKDYRKAQTAEKLLVELIEQGEQELSYLESVLDELSRADTDTEISLIRLELSQGGYIKNTKAKKQKPPKELPPYEFVTTDGFRVLVGRNNIQNDKLSLKTARKTDMWLHTQKTPGSHVIICGDNKEISDLAIEEAAVIAATYSKAKDSSLVPVDYTRVKQLKKPVGSKAGMVIYHEYYTIIVNPDKDFADRQRIK